MHMRFGVHLFGEGDYDGAMAHFGMCSRATPVLLLKLFPSLAPTALMEPIAHCFPGAHGPCAVTRLSCRSRSDTAQQLPLSAPIRGHGVMRCYARADTSRPKCKQQCTAMQLRPPLASCVLMLSTVQGHGTLGIILH